MNFKFFELAATQLLHLVFCHNFLLVEEVAYRLQGDARHDNFHEFFHEKKFVISHWIDKETSHWNIMIKFERIFRSINIVGFSISEYFTYNPKFHYGENNFGFTNFLYNGHVIKSEVHVENLDKSWIHRFWFCDEESFWEYLTNVIV